LILRTSEAFAVVTFIDESNQVSIPSWVTDLNSFRRWADSGDFPDTGRICYTETLRKAYWEAGIPEYWLVDARPEPLSFEILKHASRGYSAVRKQAGWVKSAVFGRSFCLVRTANKLGHPEIILRVRD
jgi:hypothetical protein